MSEQEEKLIEKLAILTILIDTHVRLENVIWQDKKAFQEYMDVILDEMNETKKELKEIQDKKNEL